MKKQIEEWKAQDGAVDSKQFQKEKIKILWVLREPNGEGFDFKSFLKDPERYNKWKQSYGLVVKTSNALLNGLNDKKNFPYPNDVPQLMSRIALINVKKTGGKATIDHKKILEYLSKNPDELKKQIEELKPDIMILAGTDCYISPELMDNIKSITGKNIIIVKTYHPSQRSITHNEYISKILDKTNE